MSDEVYQQSPHLDFKIYLLKRGTSQRQLARQLGITVQYLNDVLRGRRPGVKLRRRLAIECSIPEALIEPKSRAA